MDRSEWPSAAAAAHSAAHIRAAVSRGDVPLSHRPSKPNSPACLPSCYICLRGKSMNGQLRPRWWNRTAKTSHQKPLIADPALTVPAPHYPSLGINCSSSSLRLYQSNAAIGNSHCKAEKPKTGTVDTGLSRTNNIRILYFCELINWW